MRRPQRIEPGPGQESVWDYPRPPAVEPVRDRVVVRLGGVVVADTTDAVRVLETSHPPVYYLPVADLADGALVPADGSSMCEFKGRARYFDVRGGDSVAPRAAWNYPTPEPGYESLRDRVAIYPSMMDSCEVGGEVVHAQEGDFYGGWITADVVGPFKGGAGTFGW
ncbi:uncharacterized protein (DUF427 family) [Curtobacterium luteum]|uniref:Uncharacterized protein (DUF427 family) n=1 Tax=Curtobacterium luteum TaxID=33881 RepID=A0ABS2RT58_9MICO|nr:DUF427 domain-containing protein [Curtobacterium luteum]MBM7801124.1 uncharacterized protein (DUF427 family) [Curtobacterium luteum]NUU52491.1 DUF427 domain-containing protein [Curtobacterium luteum]